MRRDRVTAKCLAIILMCAMLGAALGGVASPVAARPSDVRHSLAVTNAMSGATEFREYLDNFLVATELQIQEMLKEAEVLRETGISINKGFNEHQNEQMAHLLGFVGGQFLSGIDTDVVGGKLHSYLWLTPLTKAFSELGKGIPQSGNVREGFTLAFTTADKYIDYYRAKLEEKRQSIAALPLDLTQDQMNSYMANFELRKQANRQSIQEFKWRTQSLNEMLRDEAARESMFPFFMEWGTAIMTKRLLAPYGNVPGVVIGSLFTIKSALDTWQQMERDVQMLSLGYELITHDLPNTVKLVAENSLSAIGAITAQPPQTIASAKGQLLDITSATTNEAVVVEGVGIGNTVLQTRQKEIVQSLIGIQNTGTRETRYYASIWYGIGQVATGEVTIAPGEKNLALVTYDSESGPPRPGYPVTINLRGTTTLNGSHENEVYIVQQMIIFSLGTSDLLKQPSISIPPRIGKIGTTFHLEGKNFTPSGTATFHFVAPNGVEFRTDSKIAGPYGFLSYDFTITDGHPTGQIRLWAVDDVSGARSNDVTYEVPATLLPDLTVTIVTAPTVAKVDETIRVAFTIKELNGALAGPFRNLVALGTSPWDTQIHLGYFAMDSIGPSLSKSDTVTVTIPSTVLAGSYWVTVYTNPGEAGESNPNNNIEHAPNQILIEAESQADITRPTVSLSGPGDGETWVAGTQKTITWSAKDDVGVVSVDLYFTSNGWQTSQKVYTALPNVSSYTWTVPSVNTTEAQFMTIAWDAAGRAGLDLSGKFTITSAPVLLPAPILNDPQVSGTNYQISWSSVNGASSYVLQEGSDSQFSSATQFLVTQTSKYFSERALGTYYYRVAAVDSRGLQGNWSQTKSVTLQGDLGPGEITLTSPLDNATGQPLTVTLQWSASHPGGERLRYDVFLMPFASDTLYSAHIVSSGQAETSYTAANLDCNKKYSWGVRAWDETGQSRVSAVYHFTTVGDVSPPAGSISINNGATTTDSYAVTLYLSASDNASGVRDMRFSNDGNNWMTNWEWFSPRYPWNIADYTYGGKPNQDVYTVYAQFRDMQLNESPVYSDTITKVQAKPGNIILNGNYYETIRDAVAAAESGDTVYLTDGTYTIYGEVNPPRYPSHSVGIVLKPGVTLRGAGADRTKIAMESGLWTVIDADNSTIEGLTIIMAQPNVVRYAVLMESGSSEIRNSVIESTYGGIEVRGSNNLIANNLLKNSGDGINVNLGTNSRIYNNTIVYNSGNGIVSQDTAAQIKNNIIAYNNNFGVYVQPNTDFKNNDVYGNFRNYAGDGWLSDQTGKNGNISADPLLTTDYRLNSGSPAINAGTDVGIPFSGSAPDVGAFEYGATGTLQVSSNRDDAAFTIFGPQNYSGTVKTWSVSSAPIGLYSIVFSPIPQYYAPQYQTKALMSNQTLVFDGTYLLDNVPPYGIVSVNFDEYATGNNIVSIALTFTDSVAGLGEGAQMRFSNDGASWSSPEPYSTLKANWDLTDYGGNSNSGVKTVFVKVSDALGNWTDEPITDTILYVPDRQILEVPTQYGSIQSAIDAAQDGDVVHVLPGDYQETIVLKQGVRLQGSGPDITSLRASDINDTVITTASNSTIDGFTINKAPVMGYIGILVQDTSPIISNNIIRASRGVQILGNSRPIIRNNLIMDSTGLAILIGGETGANIENNTIVRNAGGIYLTGATPNTRIYVINNIIANNSGAGITDTNTQDISHKHIFSSFNLFWQNTAGNFEGYNKDKISGAGDMDADPLFADSASGNFSLKDSSPAINSGHPEARYNNTNGTRNNRGAYGGPSVNTRPKADFVANPVLGGLGTVFTFDASTSYDFESANETLSFRWDFDGDGTYETDFQTTKQVNHQYTTPGEYNVILQVRDRGFFVATTSKTVEVVNQSPNMPSNPSPADDSIDQPVELTLSWTGGHLDPGVDVTYDVYFGPIADPPLVSPGQTETTYNPGTLQHHQFYFWKIVATDSNGMSVSSPVWSFLTESEPVPDPPSNLVASVLPSTRIDLEWADNSSNELGFKIERKIGTDDTYALIDVVPAATISFSDSNLTKPGIYFYRVRAYNSAGDSSYADAIPVDSETGNAIVPPEISFTPATDTTITAGESITFVASLDSGGPVAAENWTWDFDYHEGDEDVDATGMTPAAQNWGNVAGDYIVRLTATNAVGSDAETRTITVGTGPLDHVAVTPTRAFLQTGADQQFTASAYDQYNNLISVPSFNWSVVNGGGNITEGGLFTAGETRGIFLNTVQAETSHGGITKQGTATVSIGAAVVSTVPGADATNVPVTTTIKVTFSEAMNQASAEAAFSLDGVAGNFTWDGNTMVFTPDANLASDTTYTATITTAAKDVAGSPLADEHSWSFTTMPPCFIATASYDAPSNHDIAALRSFRDKVLAKTTLGQALVKVYYVISPPVASALAENDGLRTATRLLLVAPLSYLARTFSYLVSFIILAAVILALLVLVRRRKLARTILKCFGIGLLTTAALTGAVFSLGYAAYTWSFCGTMAAYILPMIIPLSVAVAVILPLKPSKTASRSSFPPSPS